MLCPDPHPTPAELEEAPEASAIALLDHALYAVSLALVSANSDVNDADHYRLPRGSRGMLAEAVLNHADALQRLLHRYRQCAAPRRSTAYASDDDPF